ncbi:MAG: lipase family protein [Bacteroidia bacterium]
MKFFKIFLIALLSSSAVEAQILEYTKIDSLDLEGMEQVLTDFGVPPGFINVRFPIDFYRVRYMSRHPQNDEPIEASGAIAIPRGVTCEMPLASYQHGTVSAKSNVPSFNNFEANIGKIFAGSGYVVCMPDYIGLGTSPGLHPYVHARSEADAALDLLRAARQLQDSLGFNLNNQLFIFGYSQGGHATMALHKEIEEQYPFEFEVTMSAPMSGPYDLSGVQAEVIIQDEIYPTPGYLPYVVFAYQSVYGNFYDELSDVFLPPYDTSLLPLFDGMVSMADINAAVPAIPNTILVPELLDDFISNPDNVLRTTLALNDVYDWVPQAPVRIMYCNADDQVGYLNSVKTYDKFIENGALDVEYYDFGPFNHNGCVQFCLLAAYSLFEERKDIREDLTLSADIGDAVSPGFQNGSIEIMANGGELPYVYSWSVANENGPNINGLSSGTYSLVMYDAQNCYIDTSFDVTSTLNLPNLNSDQLAVFPNPAMDFVKISLPEKAQVSIFTLDGKLIYRASAQNDKIMHVNTSLFNAGYYHVQVQKNNQVILTKQLIISR